MRRSSETGVWWASPHVAAYIALMPTVLAIFLVAHQYTLHDVIGGVTLPSGSINFASALALSKGQLPYDNFVLAQPPGMSILLLPFAWAAHGSGASAALSSARILTAVVSIVDVFLVGFTARHHGIAATFIAGVLFATFPYAFFATSSVTVEPFLVLFCLLAFQAAFTQGQLASGGRLVLAGALIGFAIALKPWAVVPAVVLLICAAIYWREALFRVLGGVVIGIGVPCIIFFLAAPGSFFRDVITAELPGSSGGAGSAVAKGLSAHVAEILGLGVPLGMTNVNGLAIGVGAAIVVIILVAVVMRASSSTVLDWALLGTTVALVVICLLASNLPLTYTYFLAAFGAIVIGNSVGTLLSVVSSVSLGAGDTNSTIAGASTILCVALMVAVVGLVSPPETSYWHSYYVTHGTNDSVAIEADVPAGSCVISNDAEVLLLAHRLAELPAGCPYLVDPTGIELAAGSPPLGNASVVSQWEQLLSAARYVVIAPDGPGIPFSPALRKYFDQNFVIIYNTNYEIYKNKSASLATS